MNGLCISSYGLVCQHLRALCANECVSVKPCVLARMCVTKTLGDLDLGSHKSGNHGRAFSEGRIEVML